ncbi:MAG TPA: BrxA family protein [Paludibacter sp.]
MSKSIYSASFTAGSLLYKETTALLPLLLSSDAENLIKDEIKQNNLLKINSENSRKRIVSEIVKRLSYVDDHFWKTYAKQTESGQKLMLFYLCLKAYKLMFDFHFNVTVKQWNSSVQEADPYLYQMQLSEIASKDESVDKWTDLTKGKVVSVYLNILKDIKILDAGINKLKAINAPNAFFKYFTKKQEQWFMDACLLDSQKKKKILEEQL